MSVNYPLLLPLSHLQPATTFWTVYWIAIAIMMSVN